MTTLSRAGRRHRAAILKEPEMGTQARLLRPLSEPGGEDEDHHPMRLPWRPLMLPLHALRQADRKTRTHSKGQTQRIADSILHLGFINPAVVDRRRRWPFRSSQAPRLESDSGDLRRASVRCSAARLQLADNKLAEGAGWDRETLAVELEELQPRNRARLDGHRI